MTFELPTPPKSGRIDKYANEFRLLYREVEAPNFKEIFENFMSKIFRDCEVYLNKELGVCFPKIRLKFYYNKSDFLELEKKLSKSPHRPALVFKVLDELYICLDMQDHKIGNWMTFTVNLCVSYIEELVHIIDLRKSEVDIHEIVCHMIEGFLEMPLPEKVKKERLRIAKEIDESKFKG